MPLQSLQHGINRTVEHRQPGSMDFDMEVRAEIVECPCQPFQYLLLIAFDIDFDHVGYKAMIGDDIVTRHDLHQARLSLIIDEIGADKMDAVVPHGDQCFGGPCGASENSHIVAGIQPAVGTQADQRQR